MNPQERSIIAARAEHLFPVMRKRLLDDSSDYSLGQAYRFIYLLLRRPRAFLTAFREGDLRIDLEAVEEVYWVYRHEIPGTHGLSNDEREVIRDHNAAVDDYLASPRKQ